VINDTEPFFKSRPTILERPSWRDDAFNVELAGSEEVFNFQIIGVFSQKPQNTKGKKSKSFIALESILQ